MSRSQRVPRFDAPLAQALARAAGRMPAQLAIDGGAECFDYGRLLRRIERAAARLAHEHGVGRGMRVAYLGGNQPDVLTLLFACAELGAVMVPLNTRLAPPEHQALLADCRPALLLHDAGFEAAARALVPTVAGCAPRPLIELITTPAPQRPLRPPGAAAPDGASPVLLVYTSGTAGRPKGALHRQAQLLANAAAAQAVQGLTAADHVLTVLPLFHVGGLCIQTLPALLAGASLSLHARFDAAAALAALLHGRPRPSLTLQVPATLQALMALPEWPAARLDDGPLRAIWTGSSLIPPALYDAVHAKGVPLCNVYGSTETGPFSLALGAHAARAKPGSCGRPAPGVQARLVRFDAGGRAQPIDAEDTVGELQLRGPAIVDGYWRGAGEPLEPTLDADGWFTTGDRARRDADGDFWITGRSKDLIIRGGENIDPAEIELLLQALPGVAEVAVLGLPDARWGEQVVAVVVPAAGAPPPEPARLAAALAGRIARFKLPGAYLLRHEPLPRTALGKVQKVLLRAQLEQGAAAQG
jgi:fatty-acyl-CoA synthase